MSLTLHFHPLASYCHKAHKAGVSGCRFSPGATISIQRPAGSAGTAATAPRGIPTRANNSPAFS